MSGATCRECGKPIEGLDGWIVAPGHVVHLACLGEAKNESIVIGKDAVAIPEPCIGSDSVEATPNPRAEVCRKCGEHIRTVPQRCEFDGKQCKARRL